MTSRVSFDGVVADAAAGAPQLPGCFELLPGWLGATAADALFAALVRDVPWQQTSRVMYGRRVLTPRLTCWFGDVGYTYSGGTEVPHEWLDVLVPVRAAVEAATGARFNSCLTNRYRDGRDKVGFHRDNERGLRPEDPIASLSLGSVRDFRVRAVGDRSRAWTVPLGHGDLLVMRAGSQVDFEHEVPLRARAGERVNLTFRWFEPGV